MSNGVLTAAISTRGAELKSLRTADGSEWLWQGDARWWASTAPILFPVIGRSPNGHVSIGGSAYPMPSHGVARHSEFALIDHDVDSCTLRLTDNPETRASFPFSFQLDIRFRLYGSALEQTAEIVNPGAESLWCSFGFHPGFAWPLPGSVGKPHVLTLDGAREPRTRRLNTNGALSNEIEPSVFRAGGWVAEPNAFVRDAILIDEDWGGGISFGVDGGPQVRVLATDLPYLGIWSKPGAEFLCIEPWHGLPPFAGSSDALQDRPGIMKLAPGERRLMSMVIDIS